MRRRRFVRALLWGLLLTGTTLGVGAWICGGIYLLCEADALPLRLLGGALVLLFVVAIVATGAWVKMWADDEDQAAVKFAKSVADLCLADSFDDRPFRAALESAQSAKSVDHSGRETGAEDGSG